MNSTPQQEPERGCPRLNLRFRNTRLQTVLDHLQQSTGLPIGIKDPVQVERTIDLWHEQPLTTSEALALLKRRLVQVGCTLIQKGARFSIVTLEEAKKSCIALPTISVQPAY